MSTKAQSIISKIRKVSLDDDPSAYRWTDSTLIEWIDDAQKEILIHKPEAFQAEESNFTLNASTTRHSLATLTGFFRLLGVYDGQTHIPIHPTSRKVLQTMSQWPSGTFISFEEYAYEGDDPHILYTPPLTSEIDVTVRYARVPDNLTGVADTLDVKDIYNNIVIDYVLYRVFSSESDIPEMGERAFQYWRAYNSSLGIKITTELRTDIKKTNIPILG